MASSHGGAGTRFDLTGRVALVTGGNGGIGMAMALGMAEAGAEVVISGRDVVKGEQALATLRAVQPRVRFVAADVGDPAACRGLVADVLRIAGRLDVLVNNAGITARKRPKDLGLDEWQRVLDTNLTSAFLCSQAAYPAMAAAGGGKIISIGSMMSLFGAPFAAAYGASKGGIVQLTRSLAAAWAPQNIQVNAILPGWVATDMGNSARQEVAGLEERVKARTLRGAGAAARISPASRCFSPAPPRTSSPEPRSRSTAATPLRDRAVQAGEPIAAP